METRKYYGIEEIMKLAKKYSEKKIKMDKWHSLNQIIFIRAQIGIKDEEKAIEITTIEQRRIDIMEK